MQGKTEIYLIKHGSYGYSITSVNKKLSISKLSLLDNYEKMIIEKNEGSNFDIDYGDKLYYRCHNVTLNLK